MIIGNDPSKCMEDRGNGFVPDDDCITCEKPPKQKCADGYIMDSTLIYDPPNQCTKITCTNPGNQISSGRICYLFKALNTVKPSDIENH